MIIPKIKSLVDGLTNSMGGAEKIISKLKERTIENTLCKKQRERDWKKN